MCSCCLDHVLDSVYPVVIYPSFGEFIDSQPGGLQLVIGPLGAGVVNRVVEPDGCFDCVGVVEVMPVVVEEVQEGVDVIEGVVVARGLGVESGEFGDDGRGEEGHFVEASWLVDCVEYELFTFVESPSKFKSGAKAQVSLCGIRSD